MSDFELLETRRSIVLAIDLQGKLMEMIHRPGMVVAATKRLLRLAEIFHVPVLLTEQYPVGIGPTHPEIRETFDSLSAPTGYLSKTAFGCCGDAGFERALAQLRPGVEPEDRQLVVAGIEAHVCVLQTVIESLAAGSAVHVCWDCVSGRGDEYRHHALQRMQQAGACITNHESVGFEWAREKGHPGFRPMSRLLREGQPG